MEIQATLKQHKKEDVQVTILQFTASGGQQFAIFKFSDGTLGSKPIDYLTIIS